MPLVDVGRVTDLPPQIPKNPLVTEIEASVLPIIEVGVTGEIPYKELRRISTQLENDLDQVPGVAKIDRIGYRNREILLTNIVSRCGTQSMPLSSATCG